MGNDNLSLNSKWTLENTVLPSMIDISDRNLERDILRIITQYLSDAGYHQSTMTLLDESNLKLSERIQEEHDVKRMKKAILEGDWAEVDRLCARPFMKNHKSFLYAAYEQQYLEYIEHHEIQKAFTHLQKRLKPLEHLQRTPTEFRDLCYLLTSKNVQDVPSFKNWEGISASRDHLVELFQSIVNYDAADKVSHFVPPNRLLTLIQQAVAYQVECSRYRPNRKLEIKTLLSDFSTIVIPNSLKNTYHGHSKQVKCTTFVGEEGIYLMTGSSDNDCRLFNTETGECVTVWKGHTSRIWDVTSRKDGKIVASGSGDSTIKLWNVETKSDLPITTLEGHASDVYTVSYHPTSNFVASGGYDKIMRLFDIERGLVSNTFTGHTLSVSSTIFSPLGNLMISGSKDSSIKFWDILSGLCIKTISTHLGEVTSVDMSSNGYYLLSSSKDNSNRLWDIRMLRPVCKFKGHQNTCKNFIRSSFAGDALVVGGSEDGMIYVWDKETGDILQRLRHHKGIAYSMTWNARQSLFVSCSEDSQACSWWYDPSI